MEPPKDKMPMTRALLMAGTALFFSIIILIFSTLPFTAPFFVGSGTTGIVENYTGGTVAKVVGTVTGVATGALEVFTGADVAISAVGEIVAGVVSFMAWVVFYTWFMIAGIKLMNGRRALNRFFISGTSVVTGLIPFINIIPSVFIGVLLTIWQTRKEDADNKKEYFETLNEQQKIPYARG
ncbi:MAG TPA: hypothetical protein ENJ75_01605 [Candidatus Kaiserbacteria bacterium]|nr:hypothetical protein [Candidatus Kaiserbacteria bacterium]